METSVWVRVIKRGRIAQQETEPCDHEGVEEALEAALYRMDLPKPLWLQKHQREWDEFGLTRFLPDDFLESVDFQRLEIEFIDPDAKKKKSRDYRNEF